MTDWPLLLFIILIELVLGVLVATSLLASLTLRRLTGLGRALARFHFVFAVVYFLELLVIFVPFFDSDLYALLLLPILLFVALGVVWELKKTFGGFRPLFSEAWHNLLALIPFVTCSHRDDAPTPFTRSDE